ncbi:MAG: hypothetical protein ACK2TV_03950, partial [Anaerolineales bacterium]
IRILKKYSLESLPELWRFLVFPIDFKDGVNKSVPLLFLLESSPAIGFDRRSPYKINKMET